MAVRGKAVTSWLPSSQRNEFFRERDRALLSYDAIKILLFHERWDSREFYNQLKGQTESYIISFTCKTVMEMEEYGLQERVKAADWLIENGYGEKIAFTGTTVRHRKEEILEGEKRKCTQKSHTRTKKR